MTTPIKVFGDYVACFEADPEDDISMRRHFIRDCGWTEAQFRRIKGYAWFRATITIYRDGKELAAEYLGACCYETEEEFYTVYAGDYWCDKVHTCALSINDPALLALVDQWRQDLRSQDLAQHNAKVSRKRRVPASAP